MRGRLDHGKLTELFEDLADHLREERVRGHIYLVGGAAMMLAFQRNRTTWDVDAYVRNQGAEHASVMEAVRRVAGKHGLPENWLNELATTFMPIGEDLRAPMLFDSPHLVVTGASAEHMLAMKLLAGREADLDDIDTLLEHLQITTSEDALELHKRVFPTTPVSERARAHLMHKLNPPRTDHPVEA